MAKTVFKKPADKKAYNIIYSNFIKSFDYLKFLKTYILFSLVLLVSGMIVGLVFPDIFKEQVLRLIKELLKQTESLGPFELVSYIIFNNIKTSFLGIISGIFFSIVPAGILIVNGYVLGFVINKAIIAEGFLILWKLFPHGVFEIPAVIISIGAGIRLGVFPFYIENKKKGFFSIIVFLASFLFFSSILLSIFFLAVNPDILKSEKIGLKSNADSYSKLLENPAGSFGFFVIVFFCFIFSFFLSFSVLDKSDKEILTNEIRNSLRIFVFIVMPLLVIAGIIEGLLIWMLG